MKCVIPPRLVMFQASRLSQSLMCSRSAAIPFLIAPSSHFSPSLCLRPRSQTDLAQFYFYLDGEKIIHIWSQPEPSIGLLFSIL